jgi:glycosyltransferase involved in cell wall biosynthesis
MTSSEPPVGIAMREAAPASSKSAAITILAFTEYFIPGYKGGGPIRTLANMAAGTARKLNWRIVTRDRDLGDTQTYPGVRLNQWQVAGGARVFYTSPQVLMRGRVLKLLLRQRYDILYLNSVFSRSFSMLPLLAARLAPGGGRAVIVAPRGEFSPGAIAIKRGRKVAFLRAAKLLGLYNGVHWHASTELEANDIRTWFGRARISIAPNPAVPPSSTGERRKPKSAGTLKIAFVSRVVRKKNLLAALRALEGVAGTIQFNVFGPLEDVAYVAECRRAAAKLPPSVSVDFHGPIRNSEVVSELARHDLFFLPTKGENFGHVILEALSAGCPVLVSDQTPWRGLADRNAGWDLPLSDPEAFRRVLSACVEMDAREHERWAAGARRTAEQYLSGSNAVLETLSMFQRLAHAHKGT